MKDNIARLIGGKKVGTVHNFICPETGTPCENGSCLVDKCIAKRVRESAERLEEIDRNNPPLYHQVVLDGIIASLALRRSSGYGIVGTGPIQARAALL